MKILFVLEYYPPHVGGLETIFENLCERLVRQHHDIVVLTSLLKGTEKFENLNGVQIHRINTLNNRYLFTILSIPAVFNLSRDADLIHTTTYNGAFPAWFVSRLRRKRCLITVHEVIGALWGRLTGMSYLSAKFYQLLEKLVISIPFDRYICISKYTYECLKKAGVNSHKMRMIYNGVNKDFFKPDHAGREKIRKSLGLVSNFVFMYYGRPGIAKGVEYLIQSVPYVIKRIPNSKLLLILAKEPSSRYRIIKGMIEEISQKHNIVMLDPVSRNELPAYIAASDCVVIPSLSEGFGFTAVEACSMGKPVVASNVGSLPEVVFGRHVFVQPGNKQAIARAIYNIYKGKWKTSGVKDFSWDHCVENYVMNYAELIAEKRSNSD